MLSRRYGGLNQGWTRSNRTNNGSAKNIALLHPGHLYGNFPFAWVVVIEGVIIRRDYRPVIDNVLVKILVHVENDQCDHAKGHILRLILSGLVEKRQH